MSLGVAAAQNEKPPQRAALDYSLPCLGTAGLCRFALVLTESSDVAGFYLEDGRAAFPGGCRSWRVQPDAMDLGFGKRREGRQCGIGKCGYLDGGRPLAGHIGGSSVKVSGSRMYHVRRGSDCPNIT